MDVSILPLLPPEKGLQRGEAPLLQIPAHFLQRHAKLPQGEQQLQRGALGGGVVAIAVFPLFRRGKDPGRVIVVQGPGVDPVHARKLSRGKAGRLKLRPHGAPS